MIEVLVVIYGLVVYVPEGDTGTQADALTVLFVEAAHHGEGGGHEPVIRHLEQGTDGTGELGVAWSLGSSPPFRVTVRHEGEEGEAGSIALDARPLFPRLEELVGEEGDGLLRSECLESPGDCKTERGRPLVLGSLRFEGEWETYPASRCSRGWDLPIAYGDGMEFTYRRAGDLDTRRGPQARPLATALILRTTIMSREELEVVVHGSDDPIGLAEVELGTCRGWVAEQDVDDAGDLERCMVIEMGNRPVATPSAGPCPPLDRHFAAFYDLVQAPPKAADRWLPNLETDACGERYEREAGRPSETGKATVIVNYPSCSCPQTFAKAAPAPMESVDSRP